MIREAGIADIPALLKMGQRFAAKAKLADHVGYNPAHMAETFRLLIEAPEHVILIGESGAIGGTSGPHPFNHEHWIAQELFWWSEGREGLRLLAAFEAWAAQHCASVTMITLEAVEPVRTGNLYQRRGYAAVEHSYLKRL